MNEQPLRRLHLSKRILVAEDGERALAMLAQLCAGRGGAYLVPALLDLHLPRINELELIRCAPALPLTIVALTTSVNPRNLARLRRFSFADVLEKLLT